MSEYKSSTCAKDLNYCVLSLSDCLVLGSHKKQAEPAEPVMSDMLPTQSQSVTSFSMATSYSDSVSTASTMLSSAGLSDGGMSQGMTQSSVSQSSNIMDDVMATVTSSSAGQGASQIDMPTMSLGSRLTVAINSSVTMTTSMSSLEPFNLGVSSVSSQSQSLSSSWLSLGSSPSSSIGPNFGGGAQAGKMTSPSYNEGIDHSTSKGVYVLVVTKLSSL